MAARRSGVRARLDWLRAGRWLALQRLVGIQIVVALVARRAIRDRSRNRCRAARIVVAVGGMARMRARLTPVVQLSVAIGGRVRARRPRRFVDMRV